MRKLTIITAILLVAAAVPLTASAQEAELVITKQATASEVIASGTATFMIEVKNTGTAASTNVVITDTLNANLSLVGSIPDADVSTNTSGQTVLTFNLGDLAPDESVTVTIDARASGNLSVGSVLGNIASVTADGDLSSSTNAAVTIKAQTVDETEFVNGVGGAGEEAEADELPRTGLGLWLLLLPALALAGTTWKRQRN